MMFDSLNEIIPLLVMMVSVALLLWGAHWLLIGRHTGLGSERKFTRQLMMLGLTVLGLLTIIFALPVSEGSRNNLLGLLGVLLSGVIAFSSTTIFANLAAGVLLRITKPFRTGDFIRISDYFGRVVERGLFDTEIQTETRELVALPNSYFVGNPVTTIRSSGTIISASLSLGYDLGHGKIETLLIEAAQTASLEEPFVHIVELGDFSVTYRVSGFLKEPKQLISARSKLYACILDTLHANDVEITSPTYMNQRQLNSEHKSVPKEVEPPTPSQSNVAVEDIAFDKADQAEALENEKRSLLDLIEKTKTALKQIADQNEKSRLQDKINAAQERLKQIEEAEHEAKADAEKAHEPASQNAEEQKKET